MGGRHKVLDSLRAGAGRLARAIDPSKPAVDVLESDSEIVVVADVPGAAREGLDLRVEGEELTLTALVPARPEGRALCTERVVKEWRRRFRLRGVDADRADARLADGVLTVRFPKRPGLARRHVDIRQAGQAPTEATETPYSAAPSGLKGQPDG
jgi:HSP20 family molecular chaperone IbpA